MSEPRGDCRNTLKDVLAFVDGHVKFAEAKNAAILAANAAAIIGVGQILSGDHPPTGYFLLGYLLDLAVFCGLAGVVTLVSFLPQTHIPWLHKRKDPDDKDNLYFFGHIQKYRVADYAKAIRKAEGIADGQYSVIERMLAEQTIVNSRIASLKFFYARCAMWLTLSGVVTPVIAFALYWFIADRE